MTMVQAYARFMILFFFVVGVMSIIAPLSDASSGGLVFWPEAAKVLGIFLVNWFHFVLHLALCAWAVLAFRRTGTARTFAQWVFGSCLVLVLIGLFTKDGLWLVPAEWSQDAANGEIIRARSLNWYGFIPANPADDVINALVAASGFIFGFLPIGLRPWAYWRQEAATA